MIKIELSYTEVLVVIAVYSVGTIIGQIIYLAIRDWLFKPKAEARP